MPDASSQDSPVVTANLENALGAAAADIDGHAEAHSDKANENAIFLVAEKPLDEVEAFNGLVLTNERVAGDRSGEAAPGKERVISNPDSALPSVAAPVSTPKLEASI